jgi:hypothetical protein
MKMLTSFLLLLTPVACTINTLICHDIRGSDAGDHVSDATVESVTLESSIRLLAASFTLTYDVYIIELSRSQYVYVQATNVSFFHRHLI